MLNFVKKPITQKQKARTRICIIVRALLVNFVQKVLFIKGNNTCCDIVGSTDNTDLPAINHFF
jgi:hypothetical protein